MFWYTLSLTSNILKYTYWKSGLSLDPGCFQDGFPRQPVGGGDECHLVTTFLNKVLKQSFYRIIIRL